MKNLYLKTEGILSEIRNGIRNLNGVQFSFIFGSVAKGTEKAGSDVDVIVIGDVDDVRLSENIFKVQKSTGREINFISWSTRDFLEKIKRKNPFLLNISKDKRIWLAGDENEFVRIIKEKYGKAG